MTIHKVAVYGSLKKGKGNHGLLSTSKLIRRSTVRGRIYSLGAYPGLRLDEEGTVHVELYEVSDEVLERLDRLEGHPHYYERKTVPLRDGSDEQCYIYELVNKGHLDEDRLVKSGNW